MPDDASARETAANAISSASGKAAAGADKANILFEPIETAPQGKLLWFVRMEPFAIRKGKRDGAYVWLGDTMETRHTIKNFDGWRRPIRVGLRK